MGDKERRREGLAGGLQGYDQQALMCKCLPPPIARSLLHSPPSPALYGMYGLGSGYPPGYPALPPPPATSAAPPTTDTLGVAASQAASLNWWGMANQLATQDYLSRLQQAARDPAQFAALQAQGAIPGYDLAALAKGKGREAGEVVVSSEGLRLPRVSSPRIPDIPASHSSSHTANTPHLASPALLRTRRLCAPQRPPWRRGGGARTPSPGPPLSHSCRQDSPLRRRNLGGNLWRQTTMYRAVGISLTGDYTSMVALFTSIFAGWRSPRSRWPAPTAPTRAST